MQTAVPVVRPLSRQAIERTATNLVSQLHDQTLTEARPLPILQICEFCLEKICGVSFAVDYLSPGREGCFDGTELILDNETYERALVGDPRARFTCAHEFSHAYLHRTQLKYLNGLSDVRLYRRGQIKAYQDPEWQANTMAAALLMPGPAMRLLMNDLIPGATGGTADVIARRLGVSRAAAQLRIDKGDTN